ncbi:MAG: 50S ribosomal protein L3 [Syntrophales bacterium]|nr:50S ribosomal protein L3 [Syntrophales bacterium]
MKMGIIGRKLGMSQVFSEEGGTIPVTVIEVAPSVVVQKKTKETDGYDALQLGYDKVSQNRVVKALQGHCKKADKGCFKKLAEFRERAGDFEMGQEIDADLFKTGDRVDIVGVTKGKGFAGVVKRHGFRGGRATHGSMFHRAPGSIGASAEPSRVFKGQKLPGHMGCERKTVQNLVVIAVYPDRNLMLIKGAVPGNRRGYVLVKQAIKNAG